MYSTAVKRNINDVDGDPESKTPTKKSRQVPQGRVADQHQRQKPSVSPVTTSPKGLRRSPRKRTNEHPGLLIKKGRRTKHEVAAERAAKEAKAKAEARAKANAVTGLVNMELDQEQEEATRRQQIVRRQPCFRNVAASASGEDFDWGSANDASDTDEMDVDSDGTGGSSSPLADRHATAVKQTNVSTNHKLLISLNNQT